MAEKFVSKVSLFKAQGLSAHLQGRIYSKGWKSGGTGNTAYARTSLMLSNLSDKSLEYMTKELKTLDPYSVGDDGNKVTFIEMVAFGRTAESIVKYLPTGSYVDIIGDLRCVTNQKDENVMQLFITDYRLLKEPTAGEKTTKPTEAKATPSKTVTPEPAPVEDAMDDIEFQDETILDGDDLPF